MQADQVEEKLPELTRNLVSLDWHDTLDVVQTYFSKKAEVHAKPLHINGTKRIIKQADLYNKAFSSSQVIGNPQYNDAEQAIYFSAKRRTKAFSIPLIKHIPLVRRLENWRTTIHFDIKLKLGPKKRKQDAAPRPEETPMLMVTRMDIDTREKIPLANYLPYAILEPFLSVTSNVVATASKIVLSNPYTPKGVFKMVGDSFNSFWEWGYGKYADVKQGGFKKQDWSEDSASDLPSFSSVAITTAHDIGQGLESRAKRIGVPVDKIKEQAQHAVERIVGAASEAKDKFEEITPDVAPDAEGTSNDSAQDHESNPEGDIPSGDRPKTPLGGHDPTAPGAPSYAQAVGSDDH